MGRHRRSAAGRTAKGRATETTHTHHSGAEGDGRNSYPAGGEPVGIAPYLNPEAYTEANARSTAYLYATDGTRARAGGDASARGDNAGGSLPGRDADGGGFTPAGDDPQNHQHRTKAPKPVRTGLLGVSAAVALGAIAVATGIVPGLHHYQLGGSNHGGGAQVRAADSPGNTAAEQGGTSGSADSPTGGGSPTPAGTRPQASPTPSTAPSTSAPASPTPSKTTAPKTADTKPADTKPAATATPARPKPTPPKPTPSKSAPKPPRLTPPPVTVSAQAAAEAEVLKLVNEERAKVGCSALAANSSLTGLAETFSADMAARNFFDDTDPDGATPWKRAAKAGMTDLGGENIARGQADPAAVMQAWMNSAGHRANILNCDFKTLGVGVHYGPGGPWWTQDFGY